MGACLRVRLRACLAACVRACVCVHGSVSWAGASLYCAGCPIKSLTEVNQSCRVTLSRCREQRRGGGEG